MTDTSIEVGVPFVDVGWQTRVLGGELQAALARTISKGVYVLGEEVATLEREYADYCEAEHAVAVSSGTAALELSLRALGVGPGDEVITAANSFVASAFAVSYTGATPVFVDVDERTKNLSPAAVEAAVSSRTRAVLPVHLYGHPAPMDEISTIAARHGLAVVEDACQAHGSRYRGRRVGSLGTAAAFSFYPAKNLGALGDGGMVVTSDAQLAQRVRCLRNYGEAAKYESLTLGYNARLDELQAAALRVKLTHLDEWNALRAAAAEQYATELDDAGVRMPGVAEDVEPVWHLMTVNVAHRDQVRSALQRAAVATGIHYPIPIPFQPAYRGLGCRRGQFPVSEAHAATTLSLPMYPGLQRASVSRVCSQLVAALGHDVE